MILAIVLIIVTLLIETDCFGTARISKSNDFWVKENAYFSASRNDDGFMSPVSFNPLTFISSNPLLTEPQCRILSHWCRKIVKEKGQMTKDILLQAVYEGSEGAQIMLHLQKEIHEKVLGLSSPNDNDSYVIPRFISYNSNGQKGHDTKIKSVDVHTSSKLLPDGLHVDTNNGKHFRHFTILFYLDSCSSLGATTFPLAVPFVSKINEWESNDSIDIIEKIQKEKAGYKYNQVQEAAKQLLMEDVQHTRMEDVSKESLKLCAIIENASVSLLQKFKENEELEMGIRIKPRQGHFCLFSNLNEDGYPNPLSFHGGEVMDVGESKEVLTFFYEIPMGTFTTRDEFGLQVREREGNLLNFHFQAQS